MSNKVVILLIVKVIILSAFNDKDRGEGAP